MLKERDLDVDLNAVSKLNLKSYLEPYLNLLGLLSVPKELGKVRKGRHQKPKQGIADQTLCYC